MSKCDKVIDEVFEGLNEMTFRGDLSDIGNEIGFAIAKHFSTELGYDKDDFMSGLKHGISLVDGTHDKK